MRPAFRAIIESAVKNKNKNKNKKSISDTLKDPKVKKDMWRAALSGATMGAVV